MKSEAKENPDIFVKEHEYVINLIVSIKNKISFFPDMKKNEQGYYRELYYTDLIEKIKGQYQEDMELIALKEDNSIIYVIKKDQTIFICEGSSKVSVSQIKMEFNEFIEHFEKQSKYKRFFSSLFDW